MKKAIFLILIVITATDVYGQSNGTLADLNFNLVAMQEVEKHYAFDKGDLVKIKVSMGKGGKLNILKFSHYNGNALFSELKVDKLSQKVVIPEKGVYTLTMVNGPALNECGLKIDRNNKNKSGLNSSVKWKMVNDTTWASGTERYVDSTVYKPVQVHRTQNFYLNSATKINGKTRTTLPVHLPKNTVEWYYTYSCSRDKEETNKASNAFNLAGELSGLIFGSGGKIAGLTTSLLTAPPGGDQCDVYVVGKNGRNQFLKKQEFLYKIEGSRENYKSGVVKVPDLNESMLYLGFRNNDLFHGIHIAVEVVAITEEKIYKTRKVRTFTVIKRRRPTIDE